MPKCSTCIRSRRSPTSASRSRRYGIRVIALDHEDEVAKILRSCARSTSIPGAITVLRAHPDQGLGGLRAVEEVRRRAGGTRSSSSTVSHRTGFKVGIAFHVGSQIEDPDTYERALASADWVRNRMTAPLAALDVGGGFPAEYGHDPNRRKPEMPALGQIMSRLAGDIAE